MATKQAVPDYGRVEVDRTEKKVIGFIRLAHVAYDHFPVHEGSSVTIGQHIDRLLVEAREQRKEVLSVTVNLPTRATQAEWGD
jgi:hypothetical protein